MTKSLIQRLGDASPINWDRFWSRVDRGSDDSCWPWIGYVGNRGYGVFAAGKSRPCKAHRLAFESANGPVPEGLFVCHSCDNPKCCNPRHLWAGTCAENNRDRAIKGRTVHPFGPKYSGRRPHGEGHGSARLTESQAVEILGRSERGSVLAKEYGVSETCISRLRLGVTWKHLKAKESHNV